MLHNIVFTDNIFVLSRMLGVISQSIQLDLCEQLFYKKLQDDIQFCFFAIEDLFEKLHNQEHLHDYIDSMKCLYLCNMRFLELISSLETNDRKIFELKRASEEIKIAITKKIHNTNTDAEITTIVSEMELNELLNFQNETLVPNN
ncbi:MAG: hypothetical protein IJU92_09790 [Spirochaetaceae bacterium]|nr:hypothetical protein [Spirochaetaceae bacterium]